MQIESIIVNFHEEGRYGKEEFQSGQPTDSFFEWLIEKGIYDNIRATKDFSVTKEVMSRLKGKS